MNSLGQALRAAALLLVTAPALAQNLVLTLASQPLGEAVISTRDSASLSLSVLSGATVTVARASGREQRLQAAGFFWAQVQDVPLDADRIVLTPLQRDDGSIEVRIAVTSREGERQQSYASTVLALPGEWVRLMGPADTGSRATRTYGTQTLARETLFLHVAPSR